MIIQKLLPTNTLRRPGSKLLGVRYIVAHDTANPNSTAQQNVNYYKQSANEVQASAHTFIDDVNIIECIPQTERALHVRGITPTDNLMFGVDANDYALGIELCYFPLDIPRSQRAYNAYTAYIRDLCTKYRFLDPKTSVVGHFMLDPGNKRDPMNAFNVIGKKWLDFIADLSQDISPTPVIETMAEKKAKIIKLVQEL